MIAVIVTSLLRARLGYRTWRAVHWLAYASWPLAMAHGVATGSDSGTGWARGIYVVLSLAVVAAIAWRLRPRPAPRPASIPAPLGVATTSGVRP
jgi:sulfoxide reductase heme-binding subunit YedZ